MKTIGRILIILAVFALVMGVTYVVVNAGISSSTAGPAFQRGAEGLSPPPGGRPEFAGREPPEFRGEGRGGGWIFGAVKNIGIIALMVIVIAWPKSLMRRRKRIAQS